MAKVGNAWWIPFRLTLYHKGLTALIALGILENLQEQGTIKPLLEMEHNSAEYLHVLIEALRFVLTSPSPYFFWHLDFLVLLSLVYPILVIQTSCLSCVRYSVVCCGSRGRTCACREIAQQGWILPIISVDSHRTLASQEYLASRAKLINPLKTNPKVVHVCLSFSKRPSWNFTFSQGNPTNSSDTVYFTGSVPGKFLSYHIDRYIVADQWGNACSFIQSNYAGRTKNYFHYLRMNILPSRFWNWR
jgi:gamma-glutamyltranspeptidase/glutathione hydrolase